MNEAKWYLRTQDETFGPETGNQLVEWARLGRIQPGQEISDDNMIWRRVEDVPFLDMRFSIDIGDGNPRGPFNKAAAQALLASGRLPSIATMVEVREPFPEEDEAEEMKVEGAQEVEDVESAGESADGTGEKVRVVEKTVEKIVEVPVEKIVEKIIDREVRVEVPVEKIVEKTVVDETRVKELEGLLAEERRHTADLQQRVDESLSNAAGAARESAERMAQLSGEINDREARIRELEASVSAKESAMKDAVDRESKHVEQIRHLEDELRRLPQAASEVADIQAAVFAIMSGESEEIAKLIELEKREFEEFRKRHLERVDRLLERRRELLRRSGANIEEMTRKALIERPEDPRTVQLRSELDELRRLHERMMRENERKIGELNSRLRLRQAEEARAGENLKDVTQLRAEVQALKEQLQLREKDLLSERQKNEELNRRQATRQQALMARIASLESPSIGTSQSMSTNQSREAKLVKLPKWMRFGL
jgi:chromosome segregation ATPase